MLPKKDTYFYNNCFRLRSRVIKHKKTHVGRIALERQAGGKTLDPYGIRTIDLPL